MHRKEFEQAMVQQGELIEKIERSTFRLWCLYCVVSLFNVLHGLLDKEWVFASVSLIGLIVGSKLVAMSYSQVKTHAA
jgi:hypothetical protein